MNKGFMTDECTQMEMDIAFKVKGGQLITKMEKVM